MMALQRTIPRARIERGLKRLHNVLRLIELGAARDLITRAERLLVRSLNELEIAEHQLARLYPRYRFAQMAREAAIARHRISANAACN